MHTVYGLVSSVCDDRKFIDKGCSNFNVYGSWRTIFGSPNHFNFSDFAFITPPYTEYTFRWNSPKLCLRKISASKLPLQNVFLTKSLLFERKPLELLSRLYSLYILLNRLRHAEAGSEPTGFLSFLSLKNFQMKQLDVEVNPPANIITLFRLGLTNVTFDPDKCDL